MERIFNIDKKPWISHEKCNLKELLQLRNSQLKESGVLLGDNIEEAEPTTETNDLNKEFEELSKRLELFAKDNEQEVKPYFLFNSADEKFLIDEPDCQLKMYKLQLEHAKKMISNRTYKVNYLSRLKTTRKELLMRHLALNNRQTDESTHEGWDTNEGTSEVANGGDSIATVVVVQIWPQPKKHEKIRLEKEVLFRSDQLLTELRDQFKCQQDYGVPMDLSDNPEQQAERVFRCELFKSGFFLIEDTFYNDMRDPNNTDLSAAIANWASEDVTVVGDDGRNMKVSRGIGPFKRERMELSKFEDVSFRLGCPYLYSHQGNCEHLFTISDIRYVPNDLQFRKTRFPFVTATAIGRKEDCLRCYMCRNRPPHWYTRNNSRLPVDPFFFCENCFYSFNYDRDKRKIGQFQAYLYTSAFGIPDSIVMNFNKPISSIGSPT